MPQIAISKHTASVTPLNLFFNDTPISTATAFYWKFGLKIYLVTNWHNFTGINPLTGAHLDQKHASEPNYISYDVFHNHDPNKRETVRACLFDEEGWPLWLEHPLGRNVDVACLLLPSTYRSKILCLNDISIGSWKVEVGGEVFILGYPLGVGPDRWCVWKRASVATEPDLNVDNLPLLYVDTATARGMSGSPVIIYKNQGSTDSSILALVDGFTSKIIGIYSGRISPMEETAGAQLGRVWKAQVIDEIIRSQRRGIVR